VCTAVVPTKLPGTCKALSTRGTLERALRLVQSPMIAEVPRIGKLLPTVAAGVVLVARMCNPDVLLHVVKPGEVLAAVRAEDAALVHAPVVGILTTCVHLLATQFAPVQHLPSMQPLVLRQVSTCTHSHKFR